jgi:hypothetical protein
MASFFDMGPAFQAEIRRVREHAEKPENLYRPGSSVPPPGDDPRFCFTSGTYRVVYSLTQAPTLVIRHMSISTLRKGSYPQPLVVWTTAHHLGFTGATVDQHGVVSEPAPEWGFYTDESWPCLVVQQPYP